MPTPRDSKALARRDREQDVVHTGPGTLAGRYLRRYWQPVYMSEKLTDGAIVDVTTGFPADYTGTLKGAVAYELLVPSNAIAAVVSLPANVPTTAKISRVLPATGLLSLGVPVIVKVTINATASFQTKTQVTGTYLWLSSTAYGKSNVTTQVKYTLIGL